MPPAEISAATDEVEATRRSQPLPTTLRPKTGRRCATTSPLSRLEPALRRSRLRAVLRRQSRRRPVAAGRRAPSPSPLSKSRPPTRTATPTSPRSRPPTGHAPFETPAPTTTFPAPAFDGGDPFPPAQTTGDEPPKRRGRKVVSVVAIAALAAGCRVRWRLRVRRTSTTTTTAPPRSARSTPATPPAPTLPPARSRRSPTKVLPSVVQINVKG